MKTTDQLAAEAARDIHFRKLGRCAQLDDLGTAIIKSAIEQALEQLRAAHASDGGICPECGTAWPKHKGLCGGAHASEQPKAEPWTADKDGTLWPIGRFIGQYASEIAAAHNAKLGAQSADTKRLDELGSGQKFSGSWSHPEQKWTVEIQNEITEGKTLREAIDRRLLFREIGR